MNKVCKRIIIINIVVAVLVAGFVVVTLLLKDREEMQCAFYSLIGLYCPGCGGTRAVYSLLKLRIFDAIKYNITVPFGAFVYIYYNVRAFIAGLKNDTEYFKNQKYPLCIVLVAVLLLNFVLKNVLLLFFGIRFM
jgi:hypothetical protein